MIDITRVYIHVPKDGGKAGWAVVSVALASHKQFATWARNKSGVRVPARTGSRWRKAYCEALYQRGLLEVCESLFPPGMERDEATPWSRSYQDIS